MNPQNTEYFAEEKTGYQLPRHAAHVEFLNWFPAEFGSEICHAKHYLAALLFPKCGYLATMVTKNIIVVSYCSLLDVPGLPWE